MAARHYGLAPGSNGDDRGNGSSVLKVLQIV
jgi:hypothetical protein